MSYDQYLHNYNVLQKRSKQGSIKSGTKWMGVALELK